MCTLAGVAEPYERFFQLRVPPARREETGLHGWLRKRFPLRRADGLLTLEYVGYHLDDPPLGLELCREMSCDLRTPFWLALRLVRWRPNGSIEQVLDQEVGLGAMPALTEEGAVFLPELRPSSWRDVEAAVIRELDEALTHAGQHLAAVAVGDAKQPWAIIHGG
jgi:hypothetical protein